MSLRSSAANVRAAQCTVRSNEYGTLVKQVLLWHAWRELQQSRGHAAGARASPGLLHLESSSMDPGSTATARRSSNSTVHVCWRLLMSTVDAAPTCMCTQHHQCAPRCQQKPRYFDWLAEALPAGSSVKYDPVTIGLSRCLSPRQQLRNHMLMLLWTCLQRAWYGEMLVRTCPKV